MASSNLIKLIKRYAIILILVPLLFSGIALAWLFFGISSYTASASFVTSGDIAYAQGLTRIEVESYSNSNLHVSYSSRSSIKQITVTATGSDAAACVNAANTVVTDVINQYRMTNKNVVSSVSESVGAAPNITSHPGIVVAAFIIGLFIAICIIKLIAISTAPISSREDAENIDGLSVIGDTEIQYDIEKIIANIEFYYGRRPTTIAIIPIEDEASAIAVSHELVSGLNNGNIHAKLVLGSPKARNFTTRVSANTTIVVCCPPLSAGSGAAYIANNSDVTILCVKQWIDSTRQLEATIRELRLAKANLAGIIYCPSSKQSTSFAKESNNMNAPTSSSTAKKHRRKNMAAVVAVCVACLTIAAGMFVFIFSPTNESCFVVKESTYYTSATSSTTTTYERSENGVPTETVVMRDGTISTKTFRDLGYGLTISSSETGKIKSNNEGYVEYMEVKDSNGALHFTRIYKYYSPGVIESVEQQESDGATSITNYDESGWCTSTLNINSSGEKTECEYQYTFSADGKSAKNTRHVTTNGTSSEVVYIYGLDDNGNIISVTKEGQQNPSLTYEYEVINSPDNMIAAVSRLKQ